MLRIAVVDAGDRWQDYAEALRRVDEVGIGLVIDRNEDAARQLLVSVGGDSFSRSIDELDDHRRDSFDAAVVHSPLESRADTACQLAAQGKHLLVDAPLATTIDDLNRVIQACKTANVRLMVRQPLRNSPSVQSLRAAFDTGNLGAPGLLRIHHWVPHVVTAQESPAISQWIWQMSYCEVDLACWLFDAEPESVFALKIGEDTPNVDGGVQLHLGFPGGGMALVDCLRLSQTSTDPYFMLTLIGSTGAAYVDDHRNTNLLIQDRTNSLQIGANTDVTLQLHELAGLISAGDSSNCPQDSRRATSVIRAALVSIESGSPTTIG